MSEASPRSRYGLRAVAIFYLAALLLIPVAMIFVKTFEDGLGPPLEAITSPDGLHAFYLTLLCVGIAVPLNTAFGVVTAIVLVRHKFFGRGLLNSVIDLPFAISPVVIGLALILVYGQDGWFGGTLEERRDPGDLLHPRDGPGDDLRLAALRGPGGDAGAAGDRHRAGAGRRDARRKLDGRRSGG